METSNTILGEFKATISRQCRDVLDDHYYATIDDEEESLYGQHVREKLADKITEAVFDSLVKLNVRGAVK